MKANAIKSFVLIALCISAFSVEGAYAAKSDSANGNESGTDVSRKRRDKKKSGTRSIPPTQSDNTSNASNGINGSNGSNGTNGSNGANGSNGSNGSSGVNGLNGANIPGGLNNPLSQIGGASSGIGQLGSTLSSTVQGRTSIATMRDQFISAFPEMSWLKTGDVRDSNNNPIPGLVNPALIPGASPFGTMSPPTPAGAMTFPVPSRLEESMYTEGLRQLGGFTGQPNSDLQNYTQQLQAGNFLARNLQYPPNVANLAKAQTLGQAQTMSNAMGDLSKSQAASAISYCSNFLQNFTVDDGNRWNKIRNGLFVPIAFLLLLPGAVLTQVKVTVASANPVLNSQGQMDTNPFEGILRSVIAVFLIPASYLIVNYGIDFSNSVTFSIANSYSTIMGSNMYQDALSAEVRAFPVKGPKENQGVGAPALWPNSPINNIADFERNNIDNQGAGRPDESMPSGAVAARELSFGANAALTAGWNILCAFQMAYLAYLFFVGPIIVALWVWPVEQFRQSLSSWIEGVLTLCFWSMFWNTAILLMACFRGVDQSGTIITSALNFLALSSVKYAFDFAGLVREAGQEAGKRATDKDGAGQQGANGASGKSGSQQSGNTGMPGMGQDIGPMPGSALPPVPMPVPQPPLPVMPVAPTPVAPVAAFAPASLTTPGLPTELAPTDPLAAVALPPLAFAARPTAKDVQSQSVRLGNYFYSQEVDPAGQQVGVLKDARGLVVAHIPANVQNGQAIRTSDGSTLTVSTGPNGELLTLVDAAGVQSTAQLPPVSKDPIATAPVAGVVNPDGSRQGDSIALRSTHGTLLLENNGNTVLVPRADGNGYDAFNYAPDGQPSNFTLADGSVLTLSTEQGQRHVAIVAPNNAGREDFLVKPAAPGGYDIQHTVNNGPIEYAQVRPEAQATQYYYYSPNGNVSEVDSVSATNFASSYFDLNTGALLGNVITDYGMNGGPSTTSYYDAQGALTASTQHYYKEGASIEYVRNAQGNLVSSQELTATPGGGYTIQLARFENGEVASSETNVYDAQGRLIVQRPTDELYRQTSDQQVASISSLEKGYQLVSSLLTNGKTLQAQQLINVVNQDFNNIDGSPDRQRLLASYIRLLEQHDMYPQVRDLQQMQGIRV